MLRLQAGNPTIGNLAGVFRGSPFVQCLLASSESFDDKKPLLNHRFNVCITAFLNQCGVEDGALLSSVAPVVTVCFVKVKIRICRTEHLENCVLGCFKNI